MTVRPETFTLPGAKLNTLLRGAAPAIAIIALCSAPQVQAGTGGHRVTLSLDHNASQRANAPDNEEAVGQDGPTDAVAHAVISISRAPDLAGQKPAYRSLSRFSGQAAVISFSASRPAPAFAQGASSYSGTAAIPTSLPVAATAMTSRFGMRLHPMLGELRPHLGIDLAAPLGTPIRATSAGIVSSADWRGGYGLLVTLNNGDSLETRYGHMSRLNVVAGQQVQAGDVIGFVGSTGLSTGPHVHYEVRVNGRAIDPASQLKSR